MDVKTHVVPRQQSRTLHILLDHHNDVMILRPIKLLVLLWLRPPPLHVSKCKLIRCVPLKHSSNRIYIGSQSSFPVHPNLLSLEFGVAVGVWSFTAVTLAFQARCSMERAPWMLTIQISSLVGTVCLRPVQSLRVCQRTLVEVIGQQMQHGRLSL